jgi:hypothetical protein
MIVQYARFLDRLVVHRSLGRSTMVGVLIFISAHPVWIGLLGAYVLGFKAHLVPITGYCDFFSPSGDCGGRSSGLTTSSCRGRRLRCCSRRRTCG